MREYPQTLVPTFNIVSLDCLWRHLDDESIISVFPGLPFFLMLLLWWLAATTVPKDLPSCFFGLLVSFSSWAVSPTDLGVFLQGRAANKQQLAKTPARSRVREKDDDEHSQIIWRYHKIRKMRAHFTNSWEKRGPYNTRSCVKWNVLYSSSSLGYTTTSVFGCYFVHTFIVKRLQRKFLLADGTGRAVAMLRICTLFFFQ